MTARSTVCFWLVDQRGVVASLHEGPVRALLRVEVVCYLPFVLQQERHAAQYDRLVPSSFHHCVGFAGHVAGNW